jgi:hypothetical protein
VFPHFPGSITRIADLAHPLDLTQTDRARWRTGDLVVAEVLEDGAVPYSLEAPTGRNVEVLPGDFIVGALGRRCATLQIVGDWRAVGPDLRMDALSMAGVLGRCTSAALPRPPIAALRYRGHVVSGREPSRLCDFVRPATGAPLTAPVVLIVGTSMEAGKTTAGKAVVRSLKRLGLRVAAAKLTGVGRYRDILAMGDSGADAILDFVDVGLPSTATPRAEFEPALRTLLSRLADTRPDVVVAEAGASPLEPYNGDVAVEMLQKRVRCTILCASDPYAVVGVMQAFHTRPDLISGRATSTEAGIALIERLTGVPALNLLDRSSHAALDGLLASRLDGPPRSSALAGSAAG